MKSVEEIKEERRKLVKWLSHTNDEMRKPFVQQIKMIDWILGEDSS